jgi:hypothetical protein
MDRIRPKSFRREFPGNTRSDGEKARVRISEADALEKLDRVEARWIEVDDEKLWFDFRGQRFRLRERLDRAGAMTRRKLLQGGSDRRG